MVPFISEDPATLGVVVSATSEEAAVAPVPLAVGAAGTSASLPFRSLASCRGHQVATVGRVAGGTVLRWDFRGACVRNSRTEWGVC